MFGSSGNATSPPTDEANDGKASSSSSPPIDDKAAPSSTTATTTDQAASGDKRTGNGDNGASAASGSPAATAAAGGDKKRRSSSVGGKASSLIASAKNSLNFAHVGRSSAAANNPANPDNQSPIQKLGRQDPALAVPQGQYNNSAGESAPGPRSTFRVGVWEDRNKKCRRTMEDTHAFLYNFLPPVTSKSAAAGGGSSAEDSNNTSDDTEVVESDNGYFAIFDGHAGTFAADWCGKKLHVLLEDTVRRNPNAPMPELLDQTFTAVDGQLEKLPVKNSGCTAAIAVLRWEDRVPSDRSVTGSLPLGAAAKTKAEETGKAEDAASTTTTTTATSTPSAPSAAAAERDAAARLKPEATRQRVLYTANVGDARIVLCRSGKALRLSYDHKGSDENEGRRIANAGGLILNNRVNGVLAVTRALGDTYMKDLVTGHPYTTETVIQPESDELFIIACDGIWDVCSDQEAVDLIRNIDDPAAASKLLVDHALSRFSTDNLSCMVVRMDKGVEVGRGSAEAAGSKAEDLAATGGGESKDRVSEVDKIVGDARRKMAEDASAAVGVSPSNGGRGHDPIHPGGRGRAGNDGSSGGEGQASSPPQSNPLGAALDGAVLEEEPAVISEGDSPEATPAAEQPPDGKEK